MPTWEVIITRTSVQTVEVQAETEAEALFKAHQLPEEGRGVPVVDWDFVASPMEQVDVSDE